MGWRVQIALLAVAAIVCADEIDEATARAIDAEVHGEWIRAASLYEQAIGDGNGTPLQRSRLRLAIREAKTQARDALKAIDDPGRKLAAALEIARLLPKSADARRVIERAEKDGKPLEPAAEGIPCRSPARRAILGIALGDAYGRGEDQIDRALAFLRSCQEENGSWDSEKHGGHAAYRDGVTALALLALVARGAQGADEASRAAADRAAAYLRSSQGKDGLWAARAVHGIYDSALSIQALAEYGLVFGKADTVREPLQRAVAAMAARQHSAGGYRYQPKSAGDTSVTSRVLCALHRVRALGIDVPAPATDQGAAFIVSLVDPEFGQIGYNVPGGTSARPEGMQERFPAEHTQAMTASGALAIALVQPHRIGFGRPVELVRCTPPLAKLPDYYYWMAATHSVRASGGVIDPHWHEALVKAVAAQQRNDGAVNASDPWGRDGGLVYSTAACVLALAGAYADDRQVHPMVRFVQRGEVEVYVPGYRAGTPARLIVEKGDTIRLSDTGWMESAALQRTVDGRGAAEGPGKPLIKGAPFSCLLMRIGEKGKPFRPPLVEDFVVSETGPIEFLLNDRDPRRNQGGWTVTVRRVKK